MRYYFVIPILKHIFVLLLNIKNMELIPVKDRLPNVEKGSYLILSPTMFPKNSRFMVAEYYDDVKGFYDEANESFIEDVTHWCELPIDPTKQ